MLDPGLMLCREQLDEKTSCTSCRFRWIMYAWMSITIKIRSSCAILSQIRFLPVARARWPSVMILSLYGKGPSSILGSKFPTDESREGRNGRTVLSAFCWIFLISDYEKYVLLKEIIVTSIKDFTYFFQVCVSFKNEKKNVRSIDLGTKL